MSPLDSRLDRKLSVDPEDLSRELALRGCTKTEFAGAPRPTLGDFPVLARIGRGGMGVVYFGVHPRLETEVAIKILPADMHARQPDLVRRFIREARIAARLSSDFLVRVYDVDRDKASGLYYLIMEYVRGVSAGKWLESAVAAGAAGVPEEQALDVCIAATKGLSAAHQTGTIHRDVKPDNILIPAGEQGHLLCAAKLADLGLAGADESAQPRDERLTGTRITLMGTPGYAAPEQLEDPTKAKKPSDVFSMGAALYALLCGKGPYSRGAAMEAVLATMRGEYRPVREIRPAVSSSTVALIDVCLRKDPAARYPDGFALTEALQLCRAAWGRPADSGGKDLSTDVVSLVQRSEVGEAVPTGPSAGTATRATSGNLRIEGGAPGAQVTLRRSGPNPLSYVGVLDSDGRFQRDHVEAGSYELSAAHDGFHPHSATVDVTPGGANLVQFEMRERDGIVSLDSLPRGAAVAVDGAPVGVTPIAALAILPGSHTITVWLEGHDRAVRNVEVRGGSTTQLGVIQLEPLARIDVSSFPADVEFEFNGRTLRGGTDVRPGMYRLTVRRDGYEPQEVDVVVAARSTTCPVIEPWRRHGWSLVSDVERWDACTPADRRRVARTIAEKLSDFELTNMETFESGSQRHEVAVLVHRPTGLEFTLIPGGRFQMGSAADEPGRRPDERRHTVSVTPFLFARTPVPQSVWESVTRSNPSQFHGPGLPVERVTHTEAAEFCQRFGMQLPTEEQWEFAARAGTTSPWPAGADPSELLPCAWFAANAGPGPHAVGTRRPNAFGLSDIAGNVWEWCADGYSEYPFDDDTSAAAAAATAAAASSYRVFRGGGWRDPPERLRCAQRAAYRPDYRAFDIGLRPARALTADLGTERAGASMASTTPLPSVPPAGTPASPSINAPMFAGSSAASSSPSTTRSAAGAPHDVTAIIADVTRWDAATPAQRRACAEETVAREPDFAFTGMAAFEAGGARHEVAIVLHKPTELEFVLVPGGVLAAPQTARPSQRRTEAPQRLAVLVAPLLVCRTAVHQAAWRRVVASNPSFYSGDRLPVEQVDLAAATAFCEKLSLALPTEAQWEYACRAGTEGNWCCGEESLLPEFAWFEKNAGRSTHPVGEKRPNAFGLFDVLGNVWEWCVQERAADAAEARIRGGAWTSEAKQLQSSWFLRYPVATRMGILGFRPIRALRRAQENRP